jgi:Ca2+-binding EF-hand superfamily protein
MRNRAKLRDILKQRLLQDGGLKNVFAAMDKDDSGLIDFQEFKAYLDKQGIAVMYQDGKMLYQEMDVDGNGELSYAEMQAFVEGDHEGTTQRGMDALQTQQEHRSLGVHSSWGEDRYRPPVRPGLAGKRKHGRMPGVPVPAMPVRRLKHKQVFDLTGTNTPGGDPYSGMRRIDTGGGNGSYKNRSSSGNQNHDQQHKQQLPKTRRTSYALGYDLQYHSSFTAIRSRQRDNRNALRNLLAVRLSHGGNLRKIFAELDADGSGGVDASEFRSWLDKQGLSLLHQDGKALLESMDTSGDGMLSYSELEAFVTAPMRHFPSVVSKSTGCVRTGPKSPRRFPANKMVASKMDSRSSCSSSSKKANNKEVTKMTTMLASGSNGQAQRPATAAVAAAAAAAVAGGGSGGGLTSKRNYHMKRILPKRQRQWKNGRPVLPAAATAVARAAVFQS